MSSYTDLINSLLKLPPKFEYTAIDLFAGCGGLALGFESNGFKTTGYEMMKDYCLTYSKNLKSECHNIKLDKDTEYPDVDVIIGGPPCQPFSVGGLQRGLEDSRDGFPAFIEAVRKVKPKLWLFENVRGLMYKNKWYLDQVLETLEQEGYIVEKQLFNAVHYGVPQNRERLIVVGHKGVFKFPEPVSHRYTVKDAIGDIAFTPLESWKYLTESQDKYIAKYEKASKCITPRDLHMDKSARTLTCRNLAGATGDMHRVKQPDGRRRRITAREAARLQSFPDWFEFVGGETSVFNQIGNAVPPLMAYQIALSIKNYLDANVVLSKKEIQSVQMNNKQLSLI